MPALLPLNLTPVINEMKQITTINRIFQSVRKYSERRKRQK